VRSSNIFYFANHTQETAKGQDILDIVDSYFSSHNLSWKSCISICPDGAPTISGSPKGFVALAKQKNSGLCPSSSILETRKHNASETGSVSETRFLVSTIPDDGQILNKNMQGKNENILTYTDKINSFKET
jgi:hypothetical protein